MCKPLQSRWSHARTLVVTAIALVVVASASAQHRAIRDDGVAVILHPDGRWEVAPLAVPPLPGPSGVRVFFGNLHSHTSYSDGSATPADAYAHGRDVARLDFLAVTEHNHTQAGGAIARDHTLYSGPRTDSLTSIAGRFDEPGRFVALYGQEFSSISSGNHANVLEIGEVIDETQVPNGEWDNLLNTWLPAHADSQGQPAILLLNHPTIGDSPNAKEYGRDDFPSATEWRAKLDGHAQLINMINGPSHEGTNPGSPSEGEFLRYLDLGFHLAPTADQDNHRTNWGSAASTRTGVWATTLTKPNILTALRERRAYATQDQNLGIIGTVSGSLMGRRFTGQDVPAPGTPLEITVTFADADEPAAEYIVDVFGDMIGGNRVADVIRQHTHTGNGTLTIRDVTYQGGDQYFFLKITQRDEAGQNDRAWLAPVWFEPTGTPDPTPGPGPTPGPMPPMGPSLTLDVNLATEEARITNVGGASVDLRNWVLVSTAGNQRFTFTMSLNLAPGQAVTVTSGTGARTGTGFVRWTNDFIWRNSGDPGQLLDPAGTLRAESP